MQPLWFKLEVYVDSKERASFDGANAAKALTMFDKSGDMSCKYARVLTLHLGQGHVLNTHCAWGASLEAEQALPPIM